MLRSSSGIREARKEKGSAQPRWSKKLGGLRSWRHTYFRFLGNMTDKIYVTVVVGVAKLQRKFQRQQTPPE
uniref:Uncharacterized protein n=1 Tax=Quercus lobata TaxID=97700 RepID=A0A7N2MNB1_QUELO